MTCVVDIKPYDSLGTGRDCNFAENKAVGCIKFQQNLLPMD